MDEPTSNPVVELATLNVSPSPVERQGPVPILQREAIRLFALGWTTTRVGDALGISYATLLRWQSTPEWIAAVERFNSGADDTVISVRERLSLGAMRMLDVMLNIAEDGQAKHADKQNAADSWLDRAGYPRMKAEFGKHEHTIRAEPGFWERLNEVKAEANGGTTKVVVDVP